MNKSDPVFTAKTSLEDPTFWEFIGLKFPPKKELRTKKADKNINIHIISNNGVTGILWTL